MSLHKDLIGADLHGSRVFTGTGTPVGARTPGIIGEIYLDTGVSGHLWVANGLTNTDWRDIGPGAVAAHAATHQNGGGDEVGTSTPTANAIPKADSSATLNGWVTALTTTAALTGVISPTSFSTNQDNYSPTGLSTASVIRLTATAASNISGFAGGSSGRVLLLHNIGSFNITLTHQDTGSTAANRFILRNALSYVLVPDKSVWLVYDATTSRWRVVNTNDLHAPSHQHGGNDEIATVTPAANAIPKANASGQIASGWLPASASVPIINEEFVTTSLTNGSIGSLNWRTTGNGTGNGLDIVTIGGHPGVLNIHAGTSSATGRRSLQCGNSTSPGGFLLSTTGISNAIEVEWLIRPTANISSTQLEMFVLGLIDANDDATNGLVQNGIFVQYNPSASAAFRAGAVNGGTSSFANGTTTVVVNTWYRVAIVYTDTGSGGSLQLKVNGANEGSAVTTNFPAGVALSLFAKIDGQGVAGTEPGLDIDRVRVYQAVSP